MWLRIPALLFLAAFVVYSECSPEYQARLGLLPPDVQKYAKRFEEFLRDFGKAYDNPMEKVMRLVRFATNNKLIDTLTEQMPYTKFGITKFTDWTEEEMAKLGMPLAMFDDFKVTGAVPTSRANHSTFMRSRSGETEVVVDWRTKGVVSSVKDQGKCSSCWAFAAVASTESALVIKGHEDFPGDYSEQELMDCEKKSYGCNSGYPWEAMKYISKHGIEEEKDYPYEDKNATLKCRAKDNDRRVDDVRVFKTADILEKETFLRESGPMAMIIIIDKSLYFYKGGMYRPLPCKNRDGGHAMTAIGYGVEDGQPYWLLKNSWGPKWGEDGYIKIFKGDNTCEIEFRWASAPILAQKN